MSSIAAGRLAVGMTVGGQKITDVYRYGRSVAIRPQGHTYHELDSIVVDTEEQQ